MILESPGMRIGKGTRCGLGVALALFLTACVGCAGEASPESEDQVVRATRESPAVAISAEGLSASAAETRVAVPRPMPVRRPTVILISLDGTRPADVTASSMPGLFELGERGLRAAGLTPVNPSNTFPNHVSLATGVRPEVHRLVNNSFIDPERGRFKRGAPNEWIESEPLWSIAERNGLRTASYYWVGSEGPWRGGLGPSEFRKFSSSTLEKTKVNRILKWLDAPNPADRPQLITSWFHGADHTSHVSGPGAPEVAEALGPQDRQIARLIREMEARGLFESTTLIFVSDHGMTRATRTVHLAAELSRAGLRPSVLGIGGFSSIVFKDSIRTPRRLEKTIFVARELGLSAYLREDAPADWHVGDARFGHVVVRAPIGTAIVGRTTRLEGFHGYDAREPSMQGILFARGRGVTKNTKIGRVSNLAVAPTVLKLLGLPVPAEMKAPPIQELLVGLAQSEAGGSPNPISRVPSRETLRKPK